ncbi:VOC family protein [Pseudidiomarina sp. 1APP75-32.1]|uniref:VOC family protein n=2 Tax=Pseudidiomarina terrestris TaxID=2820060 RepID=A0AAW7R175_9GAMM|nr:MULTISPECIES: VOC family protein [unclassified Pseudidiomarina]MDN7124863.1 VOC family protein [Pseudidiomarina sp. 1APP75-32.1]MDN7125937.1 VOC family protein [Pseudidiomarina sp. 1APR75-33.1]MDN7129663.1 VOC family protein [Pseudidiomarina sp. 1APR75-15]MDN7138094.1 VOC family protein [Pseudidiomarina sp. 1ASP75-14]
MNLGAFSVSLAVKDIAASLAFYKKLGFEPMVDHREQGWAIVKNGEHVIGLFQGMFDENILTFNPGWDQSGQETEDFTDIRELHRQLEDAGLEVSNANLDGPDSRGSLTLRDPDGNVILLDQHR